MTSDVGQSGEAPRSEKFVAGKDSSPGLQQPAFLFAARLGV